MKVLKYTIPDTPSYFKLELLESARLVKVGRQRGSIQAWFEVLDVDGELSIDKEFQIVGTGRNVGLPESWKHLYTYFDGPFVWHLYEGL